jgi:hypothetical protein
MEKIKRYKLKDGITKDQLLQMGCKESENLTYICKGAVIGKTKNIEIKISHEYKDEYGNLKTIHDTSEFDVDIAFTDNIQNWNDFDNIIVLDSDWCQPYYPFYDYMMGKMKASEAPRILPLLVAEYNNYMDSLEFLEEVK